MTEIVVPRQVRNMPAAPLTTDPPAIFDEKAIALAGWYPNWVSDNNNQAADNNQNATAAEERANAAQGFRNQAEGFAGNAASSLTAVNQTVADILAVKDAIQAGPVASVMGRAGVVTGLVEAYLIDRGAASMNGAGAVQPEVYYSIGAAGANWPTDQTNARWVLEPPGGANGAVQRATQTNANAQRGWVFERYWQGADWTAWVRVLTASTVIEQVALHSGVSGTVTCDPAAGSMQMIGLGGNLTINIPQPRAMGDQLTIRIYQTGNYAIAFSANVSMGIGAGALTVNAGEWLTVTLCTDNGLSKWFLFNAGRHAG